MFGIEYYDKHGQPLTTEGWSQLLGDEEYKRVGLDEIGPYEVSTVWIGLDHQFGEGPPLVFETMVFMTEAWHADRSDPDRAPMFEFDMRRYSTLEQAQTGHEEMCILIRATLQEEVPIDEVEGNDIGLHQGRQGPADQDPEEEPEEAPGHLPEGAGSVPTEDDRGA